MCAVEFHNSFYLVNYLLLYVLFRINQPVSLFISLYNIVTIEPKTNFINKNKRFIVKQMYLLEVLSIMIFLKKGSLYRQDIRSLCL